MNKLYLKLAWSNLKNSRQFYLPYVIAGMLSAMMFYTMCAIQGNEGLSKMRGGASVQMVLFFGVIVVGVFVSIFLFYTNSFIMKRRKKELGIYNILGMGKIHIAKIMAWETFFSFLIAVGGGLILGIVFQKLLTMFLYRLTGLDAAIPFYISGWGCLHTAELFGAIYVCILLYNLMQIRLSNPVELLHSGSTGEREPKTKILQAVLGVVCIAAGYYMAITVDNPVKAITLFFVAVMLSGNKVIALDRSNMDFSNMYMLEVMTKQGFEEYMQESIPDISDGSVAIMADPVYELESIVIGDDEYPVEQTMKIPGKDAMTELVGGTVIVIAKDETALEKMRQQLSDMETAAYGEDRKVDLTYMMNFDMSGSVEEKIACANAVREHLNEWQNDETNPQIMRLEYNVVSRAEGRIDYESSNGGLFFLGLFLGSMFLMITVLIIYYKQISEGYEDKERFAIMEKVGMSNAEVKASIRSQVRTVFFLPLVTAACHLAAAYPMLKKLLALVALYNGTLFAWCLAGTVLVFGLIYLAVFAVTSRSYYKIVGNQV